MILVTTFRDVNNTFTDLFIDALRGVLAYPLIDGAVVGLAHDCHGTPSEGVLLKFQKESRGKRLIVSCNGEATTAYEDFHGLTDVVSHLKYLRDDARLFYMDGDTFALTYGAARSLLIDHLISVFDDANKVFDRFAYEGRLKKYPILIPTMRSRRAMETYPLSQRLTEDIINTYFAIALGTHPQLSKEFGFKASEGGHCVDFTSGVFGLTQLTLREIWNKIESPRTNTMDMLPIRVAEAEKGLIAGYRVFGTRFGAFETTSLDIEPQMRLDLAYESIIIDRSMTLEGREDLLRKRLHLTHDWLRSLGIHLEGFPSPLVKLLEQTQVDILRTLTLREGEMTEGWKEVLSKEDWVKAVGLRYYFDVDGRPALSTENPFSLTGNPERRI